MQFCSNRILMMPLSESERQQVSALYQNQKTMEHIGEVLDKSQATQQFELLLRLNNRRPFKFLTWCIYSKDENEFLGIISSSWKSRPQDSPEMGIMLMPKTTGKGFATEAVKATSRYLFTHCNVNSVIAHVKTSNIVAENILKKANFVIEDRLVTSYMGLSKVATLNKDSYQHCN